MAERTARVMRDSPYEEVMFGYPSLIERELWKTRFKVWEFGSSRPADEESTDSSYSNQALFSHTDGTYMTESPGLQVQACSMSPMTRLSIALIVRCRAARPYSATGGK